jgi:hypothetical protein
MARRQSPVANPGNRDAFWFAHFGRKKTKRVAVSSNPLKNSVYSGFS